jgi:hypothetical protein
MKIDPRSLIAPLVGVLVLILVVQKTTGALQASGTWQNEERNLIPPVSPYARLDQMLAVPDTGARQGGVRNPFGYGMASVPVAVKPSISRPRTPVVTVPAAPIEPAKPQLTAIVWDADPRASVRWEGRDFSVRQNSVFADFTVKIIRPNEIVLERSGQELVLRLSRRGE